MVSLAADNRVGTLLRDWRQRRRMSQLELALEADVSTRHLSFVETGRSRPSPELVLHLAERLDVPLRERNNLLLAAGYAPRYPDRSLDDPELAPVRSALGRVLEGHEPFPAIAVDRHWNLVASNAALGPLLHGVAPELLVPPANTLRVVVHPDGMAPRIVNFAEYASHLLARIAREVSLTGDPELAELHAELLSYPVPEAPEPPDAGAITVPLRLAPAPGSDGPELTFFSTITTFGTATEVTVAELSVEAFFPADEVTARALRA